MRTTLFICMIIVAATLGVACNAVADTIGYYRFEETPLGHHATWAEDGGGAVGTSSSDTVVNVADVFGSPVPRTGAANDASLDLPGTPGVVDCGDNYDIGTGDFTVEFFIKGVDDNLLGTPMAKGQTDGVPSAQWMFFTRDNKPSNGMLFEVRALDSSVRAYVDGTILAMDNQWHHVAGVVDRTAEEIRLYIDGNLDGSASMSAFNSDDIDNDGPLIMGARYVGDHIFGNYSPDLLDEIRISNAALSPDEFLTAPIPEPSSVVLLALGTVSLLVLRRRR